MTVALPEARSRSSVLIAVFVTGANDASVQLSVIAFKIDSAREEARREERGKRKEEEEREERERRKERRGRRKEKGGRERRETRRRKKRGKSSAKGKIKRGDEKTARKEEKEDR